jgi:predicted permease
MAEKHLKKCSAFLLIWDMQIKTTLRFHLTPVRMAEIKNSGNQQMRVSMWRKRNTPPLLVGLKAGTITLEISLVVPQKMGHSATGIQQYPS